MYEECRVQEEEEKISQAYENILGNLKRMLAQTDSPTGVSAHIPVTSVPNVSTSEAINRDAAPPSLPPPASVPVPVAPPAPPDARDPTLERLREMGVSFISPEDLTTPAPALSSNNSVYLPKACLPSKSIFQDSNSSLDFNSLALKYLNDEQLSELAVRHQEAQGRKQVTWGTDVPSRQPGAELSMASHQFLARYGLAGSSQPDERTSREESSPPLLPSNPESGQPPHLHIERQHIQQSQQPSQYIGNLKHLQQQQNVQQSDEAQYRGLHPRSQPHQHKPLVFPSVRPVNPAFPRPTHQNFGDGSLRPGLHLAPCSRPESVAPPPDHSVPVSQPKAPLFLNTRGPPPPQPAVPFSQHQAHRAPQHHNLPFPQPQVPQPLAPARHQFLPSGPERPGPHFRDPPSKPMEERVLDITAIRQQPTLL